MNIYKKHTFENLNFPFGAVIVRYPDKAEWDIPAFRKLAQEKIEQLKKAYPDYDRKTVFGDNPYVKFFKKFKKTYPVLLQFESVAFKDRPFPQFNPVSEVAFLLEITTFVLSGAHDIDKISGDIELYIADSREDFICLRGIEAHTYPGDFCGRDGEGIIFSHIAGADSRTPCDENSRNILYPLFGCPDLPVEVLQNAADTLSGYIKVLCPTAQIEATVF